MPTVVHAEVNAVLNKICADISDCQMYTTLFPCNECTKVIIQSGIKRVIYLKDDKSDDLKFQASRFMLQKAKVIMSQFIAENDSIVLQLNE